MAKKTHLNASGIGMGLLLGLLFGWFPLFLVMASMGLDTLNHKWSVIGTAISYTISIPGLMLVCSHAARKDGWEE